MTLKNYPQILHVPKNFIFLNTPPPPKKKYIEIQILIAQKMSLRTYENIWVPPPPPLGPGACWVLEKKKSSKLRKCDAV